MVAEQNPQFEKEHCCRHRPPFPDLRTLEGQPGANAMTSGQVSIRRLNAVHYA